MPNTLGISDCCFFDGTGGAQAKYDKELMEKPAQHNWLTALKVISWFCMSWFALICPVIIILRTFIQFSMNWSTVKCVGVCGQKSYCTNSPSIEILGHCLRFESLENCWSSSSNIKLTFHLKTFKTFDAGNLLAFLMAFMHLIRPFSRNAVNWFIKRFFFRESRCYFYRIFITSTRSHAYLLEIYFDL